MSIITILSAIPGIINIFQHWKKEKREEEKNKSVVEMYARSCEHRIDRTDEGDLLKVRADVGLRHVSGPKTRITAVSWEGYVGTFGEDEFTGEPWIVPDRLHNFPMYFTIRIEGDHREKARDIDSKIEIDFPEGESLVVKVVSKFTQIRDLRRH